MSDTENLQSLKDRAAAIGLANLTDKHLEQLARATASAGKRKERLKVELSLADEPSHVFSLEEGR